jgi:capsular polysaccharide biosynthesis protein
LSGTEGFDWHEAIEVLRRRWAIVVACVGLVGTAALVWTVETRPAPLYRSSAQVLLELRATNSPFKSSGGVEDPRRAMPTEIARIGSSDVRALVDESVAASASVSAEAVGDSDIIGVQAVSRDAADAAAAANAFADAYVEHRRQRALDAYDVAAGALRGQLDELDGRLATVDAEVAELDEAAAEDEPSAAEAAERAQLDDERASIVKLRDFVEQKLVQYQVDATAETGGARVLAPAGVPSGPFNLVSLPRRGLLGAVAGGVLGLVLLVVLEYLGDRVRTPAQVAVVADVPVLGVVRGRGSDDLDEAYRHVRAAASARAPAGLRRVVVTSVDEDSDDDRTALHLSLAFARSGRRVVLVSTRFADPDDLEPGDDDHGLVAFAGGRQPLGGLLLVYPGEPNLAAVRPGSLPETTEPADFLATREVDTAFAALAAESDLLVIACPAVLDSAVAVTVARLADAVLLDVRLGRTRRADVRRTLDALALVDAPVLGIVVHDRATPSRHHDLDRASEPVAEAVGAVGPAPRTERVTVP